MKYSPTDVIKEESPFVGDLLARRGWLCDRDIGFVRDDLEHRIAFGDSLELMQRRVRLEPKVVTSLSSGRLRQGPLLEVRAQDRCTLSCGELLSPHRVTQAVSDHRATVCRAQ